MTNGLENLVAEGLIAEVIARLKSGKEADVYIVRYGGRVVAAKVYKDREHRSFKNNADYKEGRTVRNSRSQRAMDRGSRFGKNAAEDAWKSAEVDALYKLHAAGVRVPTPVLFLEGVLLMELVLDRAGDPATRVIDMQLDPAQARAAYHDMLAQLVRILCCDLIHGDLSPYNVLWSAQGPTVIDFPQIISASHNSRSEAFFRRDARNILGHFAQIDPSLRSRGGDVDEIWRAYLRRELTPDFLPTGRGRPSHARGGDPHRSADRPASPRLGHHAEGPASPPTRRHERPSGAHAEALPGRGAASPNAAPRQHRPEPAAGGPRDGRRGETEASRRGPGGPPGPGAEPRKARPSEGHRRAPRGPEVIVLARRPGPATPAPAPAPTAPPRSARPASQLDERGTGESREGGDGRRHRRRPRRRG